MWYAYKNSVNFPIVITSSLRLDLYREFIKKKTNKQKTTKYKIAKYYGGKRHFECRIIQYRNDT